MRQVQGQPDVVTVLPPDLEFDLRCLECCLLGGLQDARKLVTNGVFIFGSVRGERGGPTSTSKASVICVRTELFCCIFDKTDIHIEARVVR
jgi:hypothetical protein